MTITMDDIDNLKYMLGAGEHIKPKSRRGYRNYAVFYAKNEDYEKLVSLGLATCRRPDGNFVYHATEVGMHVAGLDKKQIAELVKG